jgi:hypothetical protein
MRKRELYGGKGVVVANGMEGYVFLAFFRYFFSPDQIPARV